MAITNFPLGTQGTSFFSYASVQESTDFMQTEPLLTDKWTSVDGKLQQQWLVNASRALDTLRWKGERVPNPEDANDPLHDNTLAWPRKDVPGIADGVLPVEIVYATSLLAAYGALPADAPSPTGVANPSIEEVVAATGRVKFWHPETIVTQPASDALPADVVNFVRDLVVLPVADATFIGGSAGSVDVPNEYVFLSDDGTNDGIVVGA